MIRKYNKKEIPALIEIWELASTLAHPFLDGAFTQMVKTEMKETYLPNSNTWVYEESNTVIGFISMKENEITGLFVHPNYHSKGIGTALINHINQFYKGLEVEVFNENKIGKSFYKKYGFKVFKEYLLGGTNLKVLRMEKQ